MNAFSFPLLTKELTEIAARRRTYVTRVVYALLLFAFFVGMNESTLRRAASTPLYAMGSGQNMFEVLIVLQLLGIYLFLPAFTAGLITQEKERDSLVLLLLLQVAAFALLCSTLARSTVGAFIGTYVGAGLVVGGVALLGEVAKYFLQSWWPFSPTELLMPEELLLHIFPPVLLSHGAASINLTLLLCIPPLVTTLFFLLLARFYFVRRAFAPARNRLLGVFRWLDSAAQRGNRLIGNVTFRARDRALPGNDPIRMARDDAHGARSPALSRAPAGRIGNRDRRGVPVGGTRGQ